MRRLLIITALILFAGVAFGQTLNKGSVLGVHHVTINFNSGVTWDQYLEFLNDKMIPATEKHFAGLKLFVMKGDRGENENGIGYLWYFKTVEDRDMYFTAEGGLTEKGMAAQLKLQPLVEEGAKLGTYTTTHTDWIIQ
jgi:hypothetical protein